MGTYENYNKNSIVSGTASVDSIYNYAGGAQIYGYGGNDYIYSSTRSNYTINSSYGYVTLSGGNGNDTIYNNDPYVYISGGAGNDSISLSSNYSRYVTVYAGSGNDKIYDGGGYNTYHFFSGDGYDTIYNWNSTNTLNLGGAYYSRSTVGNNVVISVASGGGGAITLVGAKDSTVNITNGILANVITNTNKNSVVSGTTGVDAILNYAGGVNIYGNYGDDYILNNTRSNYTINNSYGYVTIRGEGGNDYIYNVDPYVFIYGDQGNDTITLNSNYSKYVTVYGGLGNDVIYGGGENNQYRFYSGDGFDTIYNFGSSDTLNLSGAHYTRSTVGSDIIVSITSGSGGAMTLVGAKDNTINIINGTEDKGVTLNNTVSGKTLNGSSYEDSITNSGSTVKIYASTDNDYIYNTGNYVSIDASGGDDTVYSTTGTRVSIFGGIGEDSIYNRSNYSTVSAGIGNDTIYNVTYYSSVNGGSGNDYIYNYSYYATINGSSGNDTITLYSSAGNNIIDYQPGDGYDLVKGFNETTTLRIGNGTGTYSSARSGSNTNDIIITSGAGNVTLQGAATLSTVNIQGVDNSPTSLKLVNTLANQNLIGSEYKDTINNSGSYVTIQALGGNDSITNTSGNNITIDGGLGSDTIRVSFAETISINGGDGNDSISCNHNYATITGGAGSDTIVGNHWRSQLYGGADNDYINITNYWYNTIDGGDGSDTIYAGGSQHSVSGGAGADKISLSGNNLTVNGGTGDDVIYGSTSTSHLYQYKAGDGNDTIYNWSSSDTLTVTGGEVTSTSKGNNVTLTVGSNKILLYGAKGKTININGKSTTPVELLTPQDVIKKFMKSLDTSTTKNVSTMLDNAIKAVSNSSSITTMKAAIEKMVNDCKSYDGDWDAFLKEKCDINLDSDNEDTGAISGADAGASKTEKTASSIVEETGSVDRTFEDNSFKSNGLTVELRKDFNKLGEKEQYIWQGLRSWWLPGALNLIAESYGNNFSFTSESSSTISNKMYVKFYDDPYNGELASVGRTGNFDSNGDLSGDLELNINMSYYKNIIVNNTDGKMSNRDDFYLDRVLAHEFTHAVMNANIKNATGDSGLPQFIKDGMSELTHGIDDDRTSDLIAYASDSKALEKALNVDKLFNHYPAYAGGYMFLRYIAKQFSDSANDSSYSDKSTADSSFLPTGLTRSGTLLKVAKNFEYDKINLAKYSFTVNKLNATALTKNIEISGSSANDSVKSGKNNDTIYGGAGNDSLWGDTGDDVIYGGSGDDKIYGQAGDDSLYAGIGDDTLTGGAGNDIFACEGDKDIITDYTPGEDKIKLLSGSITSTSFSGTDVIFETDSGSIVVQNGKNKNITIIDTYDNETTAFYGDTLMAVDDSTSSPVTIDSAVKNVDASERTQALTLTANALANSILGGSGDDSINGLDDNDTLNGGSGNDVLIGGAGDDSLNGADDNDTLNGGSGNDILIGGAGNDSLRGYTGDDKLSGGSGNDILLGEAGNDSLYGYTGNDTLNGGAGNDTFTGGAGNDLFIYTAGNDLINDYAAGDKISLGAAITSTSLNGSNVVFKFGSNSLTVKNGKGKSLAMIDKSGKSFSTVVSDISTLMAVTDSTPSPVTIDAAVKTVDASSRTKALTLTANSLANSIIGGSGKDSINGLDGNDTVLGGKGNDVLIGGVGNDSLNGAEDNDTLNGGSGNDILIGGAGNDSLRGYTGNDKLNGGSGNDILLGEAGNDSLFGYTGDDTLNAGAGNDTLRGGAGNDSLNGGAGNDSLWGDAGADKFFYKNGDGKDVIFGFENNDLLQITGTFNDPTYKASAKTVAFTVGDGSITLKDFGSTTLFHVNSSTYELSGNKLSKK